MDGQRYHDLAWYEQGSVARSLSSQANLGVLLTGAAQAVIAVADMVSQLLAFKMVAQDDVGVAMMAVPFYTMLDTAADAGIGAALIQRDDHTPAKIATVFWLNLLISTGLFLLVVGLGPLYGRFQGHPVIGWLLIAYAGKLIFQNVYIIPQALLRKEMRFGDLAIARIVAHLSESVARVGFAAVGMGLWCFTLSGLIRAFVFGVIIQLRHPFIPKLVFRPREAWEYVRFGVQSATSQILYQLYTNLDYVVVGHFFGATANGLYAFAYWIVLEPVKTIANVVIETAFPVFARLARDRPALIAQFISMTRLNVLAVLPFVVLIMLVIPEFLRVFYAGGERSLDQLALTAHAARILCAVGLLRALGFIGQPLLDGAGFPGRTLRYMIIASIVVPGCFVIGAIVLGPSLGLLSVAVAWAVGYPLAFVALGYLVVKTIDLPLGAYLRGAGGPVLCCVAGYAAGAGVGLVLPEVGDLWRMITLSAVALGVTAGLVVVVLKITPSSIKASLR
jgi:O-antigen/teichoic acid export membrane protein